MRRIKLKREKENFNQHLDNVIFADNKEIARLSNGAETVVELNSDIQYLQAKIGSGVSEKLYVLNLKPRLEVHVSGDRFRNKYLKFSGALIPLISLSFILKHDYDWIKFIGGSIFVAYILLLIYILIFQNSKWLNMKLVSQIPTVKN